MGRDAMLRMYALSVGEKMVDEMGPISFPPSEFVAEALEKGAGISYWDVKEFLGGFYSVETVEAELNKYEWRV